MTDPLSVPYRPLPAQPDGVAWPTSDWPTGPVPPGVEIDALVDEVHTHHTRYGTTYATVVVHRGVLVHERYGGSLEHWDRDDEPVDADTRLLSWSMAKSITHAIVGILVGDGRLEVDETAPVPLWQDTPDDPRAEITLDQLLAMRDGLDFLEDYVDDRGSDVIKMLFGDGRDDVATFAADRPLAHAPGTTFNYSSGTSNIVARIACDAIGGDVDEIRAFFAQRLFDVIGMRSAEPRFDERGTFIGSSYVYATARDFARFGLLYLRDGVWDGRRVLPEGWVDHGRRARSVDPTDGRLHGAHWWVVGDALGSFRASGYEGQSILCVPDLDLIVVRLGKTSEDLVDHLTSWRLRVRDAFAKGTP
jgi:CubicO group peptidase (beta-lactamase class C family)